MNVYEKFKQNPDIYSSLTYKEKELINSYLLNDKELTKEEKQNYLLLIIKSGNLLSTDLISLIDSSKYYFEIASTNFIVYCSLTEVNHPYKKEEQQLFFKQYEKEYIYNIDYPIKYAKNSSIVLLNTLKRNPMAIYYISFFNKVAYTEEIINYIIQNNLSAINSLPLNVKEILYQFPKIIYTLLERHKLNILYELSDKQLSEEVVTNIINNKIKYNLQELVITEKEITSSNLMVILLSLSFENIKYYKNIPNDFLANYLLKHDYIYQERDSLLLLKNKLILNNLIKKGNLDIIFKYDIKLNQEEISLLKERIKKDNYKVKVLTNHQLVNNQEFLNFLIDYYNLKDNHLKLSKNKLISNMGRNIGKFKDIFTNGELKIIIREIINNNYYLDLENILKVVTPSFYHDLYCKLARLENKINKNFNFYTFIKITEYFQHNLDLLNSLSQNKIDDNILNNLSLVINQNQSITYENLSNYQEYYFQKINNSSLTKQDKIYKYLVNANTLEVFNFINKIGNIPSITWLQLEFSKDSYEYNLLESYLNILDMLDKVDKGIITDLEVFKDFPITSRFDLQVMQENILRLYALVYQRLSLDFTKLEQDNKIKIINGVRVLDLTGMDFCFFVHDDEFNSQYDFTDSENKSERKEYNYICTTCVNQYSYKELKPDMDIYTLTNPNSLLAFGNLDIYITQDKSPLINVLNNHFVNPYELSLSIDKLGYIVNEFDFLRVDDQNKKLESALTFSSQIDNKITSKHLVLTIDPIRHEQLIEEEFWKLKNNLENLDYKSLYKFIFLSNRYNLEEEYIDILFKRINELPKKERLVLCDALDKFKPNIKEIKRRK